MKRGLSNYRVIFLSFLLCISVLGFTQVATFPVNQNAHLAEFVHQNPYYVFQPNVKNKFGTRDTLELPFFDDFSESTLYPDSSKWLNNQVYVNNDFCIEPPTYNVATFDGLGSNGRPYRGTINKDFNGPGDSLISQPINLKDSMGVPYQLQDSIGLSFFYQPNGNGYHLTEEDSLYVFFRADNRAWVKVWSKAGQATSAPFEHVFLPIDEEFYLHKGFQFMFTTYTRQVGNANHWNVDYVVLDQGRSASEDYYSDYAVQSTPTSLLKNFASMPYAHFSVNPAAQMADKVYFRASNLDKDGKNIEVRHEAFYGTTQLTSTSFPANSNNILGQSSTERNLPIYDITGLTSTEDIVIDRKISIRENGIVNKYKNNDDFYTTQEFSDYYAYDDGTAERGFGFYHNTNPSNIEGQIAYGFEVTKEDTLYALATFFTEAVYDVSRSRFQYRIWKELSGVGGATEDELIYESEDQVPGYNVANGERTFTTHYLDTQLVLPPGKYFIGWWQQSMFNLNVGWDMNYGNTKTSPATNPNIYYNNFGEWRNSDLPTGTMMMRPHFGSVRELYASVPVFAVENKAPKMYPNPAINRVQFDTEYSEVSVHALNGEVVASAIDVAEISLGGIENGIYFVTLRTKKGRIHTAKLVVLSH